MDKIILSLDNITGSEIISILDSLSKLTANHIPLWGVKIKPSTMNTMTCPVLKNIKSVYDLNLMVDAKLHDTHQTMEDQIEHYLSIGADLITVHLVAQYKPKNKFLLAHIAGVTVLTTFNNSMCKKVYKSKVQECVYSLAMDAKNMGYKHIICSARDLKLIKDIPVSKICPGIRPSWYNRIDDNQKRAATPKQAISEGADFLIIGRPLLQFKKDTKKDTKKLLEALYRCIADECI